MRLINLRSLVLIAFCFLFFKDVHSSDFQKDSFHLFLLMGQSNMAGYGTVLPEDKKPIEDVYMLRENVEMGRKYGWVEARQPIHNRAKSDRFCLAGTFAKAYKELYPRVSVGLIPMAWGGAPIMKMSKGTPFYDQLLEKMRWAQEQGQLKAVLWHQGESDTVNPEDTKLYSERLKQMIEDLRTDLNEPDLPFIIGDLAEFYGTSPEHSAPDRVVRIKEVRKTLRNMKNLLPRVGFVSSEGLRSHDEYQVHFDRASYILWGYRYLDEYWQIVNDNILLFR